MKSTHSRTLLTPARLRYFSSGVGSHRTLRFRRLTRRVAASACSIARPTNTRYFFIRTSGVKTSNVALQPLAHATRNEAAHRRSPLQALLKLRAQSFSAFNIDNAILRQLAFGKLFQRSSIVLQSLKVLLKLSIGVSDVTQSHLSI